MPAALLFVGVIVAELVGDTFVERDLDGEAATVFGTCTRKPQVGDFGFLLPRNAD
jgi:hypothetical protein